MTVIILALLAMLPAFIASSKGKSWFLWWLYGAALLPVAFIHSLLIPSNTERDGKGGVRIKSVSASCYHCRSLGVRSEMLHFSDTDTYLHKECLANSDRASK